MTITGEHASEAHPDICTCDLLIRNARVLTMDDKRTVYPSGAIGIKDRRIVAVGPDRDICRSYRSLKTLDVGGRTVHPGLVECHVHLLHTARGAFPDSLPWDQGMNLFARWWDSMDQEEEYLGSLLGCLEMARNGVTFFMDAGTVLETDAAAAAAEAIGIRASLADPFLWDRGYGLSKSSPMKRAPVSRQRALRLLGSQVQRNRDSEALVRGHVAVFGLGSASDELLVAAKACADENGVVFAQHQSFAPGDTTAQDEEYQEHALLHLDRLGVLGANCSFTHMNVIRDDEVRPVVESDMSIIWCVSSSMVWGVGGTRQGKHAEFHRMGVTIGLGGDSSNSAGRFDPALQGLLAVLTAREKLLDRGALTAEDALEMMTIQGARAVGMRDQIGSLEPGKWADVVIRGLDLPEAHPGLDPLQGIIFSAGSKSVETVMVGGRPVVESGRSTLVDEIEVYQKTREASARIMQRLGMSRIAFLWPEIE
jgi:5-methylthioadenosine/S-adenosylhomocysteine deaminase